MSNFEIKEVDGKTVGTVQDVEKAVQTLVTNINLASDKIKDRNFVGPKKDNMLKIQKECIHQMLDIVIAGLHSGMIECDKLGVLRADVDQTVFKGNAGHVNKTLKAYIAEKKAQDADKKLSDVELAKLMESPYEYIDAHRVKPIDESRFNEQGIAELAVNEPIPEVNDVTVVKIESNTDEQIVVDKVAKQAYITKGGKTFVKNLKDKGYVWAQVAKAIAISAFGLLWSVVMSVSKRVLTYAWDFISRTCRLLSDLVVDTGVNGCGFWSKVVKAKDEALAKVNQEPTGAPV